MSPPGFAPSPVGSPSRLAATSASPAGYGRSCTNCSRAKAKCIIKYADSSCLRCERLGKECQPIVPLRKRVSKKSPSSRTAKLEEKLDDLVSILRASQHPSKPGTTTTSHEIVYPPQQQEPTHAMPSRLDSLATAATASVSTPPTIPQPPPPSTNVQIMDIDEPPEPTPAQAEVYLEKFRGWLEKFPFMYLSPDISAATLRRERPFLWLCIMNVTSMSVPQMLKMKERVRKEVAQRLVVDHEPTMDVLLGLIAYLAWASMNSSPHSKPFLILFTQLATSVVYELGMGRSPIEEQYFHNCFKAWGGRPPNPKIRTLEERRALISVWFLTSIFSSFVGKLETLRWTSHMDECIEILEREKESPYDEILTSLVKIQLLADEAHKLLVRDLMGANPSVTPSCLFRKGLMSRLDQIRDNMSITLASKYVVQLHAYAAEVQIQSIGVYSHALNDWHNAVDTQRIDAMYACLRAVRSWHDLFFAVPIMEFPGLPFTHFVHLSQSQVALYRLTTSEDPTWDKEMLRNTADLLEFLDRTHDLFQKAGQLYVQRVGPDDESLWMKGCKIMKSIKANWEPALSNALGGLPTPNSQGVGGMGVMSAGGGAGQSVPGGGAPMADRNTILTDAGPIDFNDLAWMTDVFGPWDF